MILIENKLMSNFDVNLLKQNIEALFANEYDFILLMGSVGTDRFNDESDIDLAIYFKVQKSYEEMSQFNVKLMKTFDRDCDLVQLNNVDIIFARQAVETGSELLIANRQKMNIWKAQIFSYYPDFKMSRKIIEDNLLNRKKFV
jgi:predicted nucleotidyltransferase